MPITTKQPKHSRELLTATEAALKAHKLRLKPGITLEDVVNTMEANQCTVEAAFGQLAVSQHGAPVHVAHVIEGMAKQRGELFFPRDVSAVKSRDEMDKDGKVEYLRTHSLREWEALPQKPPVEQVVVLDQDRLTRKEWLDLDLSTRSQLAGEWGPTAVGRIVSRK